MDKEKKALELLKRLLEKIDDPYEYHLDRGWCFFCDNGKDYNHARDCIWIEAKKLIEGE